ncbi:hypothetical protein E2C01_058001 [Portunus trituberculatus]|uniref:Uncharacterized protein n=1 Tax=Portunus trituberculatus TaxID=210409 RepID=A0A5B7H1H3_PORTR|nr:hypothetical protein [Portunus trituberculatus]
MHSSSEGIIEQEYERNTTFASLHLGNVSGVASVCARDAGHDREHVWQRRRSIVALYKVSPVPRVPCQESRALSKALPASYLR